MRNYRTLSLLLVPVAVAVTYLAGGSILRVEDPEIIRRALPETPEDIAGRFTAHTSSTRASTISSPAELYRKSLFHPDRTESVALAESESSDAPVDMELIGIGRIGDKAVAVIVTRKGPGASRDRKKTTAETPDRNIYAEGQQIGKSGYKVSTIGLSEVQIIKGKEKRTLELKNSGGTRAATQSKPAAARTSSASVSGPAQFNAGSEQPNRAVVKTTGRLGTRKTTGAAAVDKKRSTYAISQVRETKQDDATRSRGYAARGGNSATKLNPESADWRRQRAAKGDSSQTHIISAKSVREKLVQPDDNEDKEQD